MLYQTRTTTATLFGEGTKVGHFDLEWKPPETGSRAGPRKVDFGQL